MREAARKQYKTLERFLKDTVGVGPSKETRELYEFIDAQG